MRTFTSLLVIIVFVQSVSNGDDKKPVDPPEWFKRLDKNGNGVLEGGEAGRLLGSIDSDKDGKISLREALAYAEKRRSGGRRSNTSTNRSGRGQAVQADAFSTLKKVEGKGLWVVSTGHSCVIPAIDPVITIARKAGFENHTHLMQFAGGPGGTAKAQWERSVDRQQAKPALQTGKIDVLTFGHLVDFRGRTHGGNVEDYERWIEFALKHNPDTRFLIQNLWPWLPGPERVVNMDEFKLSDYEAAMKVSSKSTTDVALKLRQKYPEKIHVIPVGQAMTELVRRHTNGKLAGVDAIMVREYDRVGLYRDKIHPTELIAAMEGYIYYACLYHNNPTELEFRIYPDEKLDQVIKQVAWETATAHPLSGVKKQD